MPKVVEERGIGGRLLVQVGLQPEAEQTPAGLQLGEQSAVMHSLGV